MATHSNVVRLGQLAFAGMVVAFSWMLQIPVDAQALSPADEPFLSGTVWSNDATPAVNVTVFLIAGQYGKPEKLAQTKTDDQGRFAFSDPKLVDPVARYQPHRGQNGVRSLFT